MFKLMKNLIPSKHKVKVTLDIVYQNGKSEHFVTYYDVRHSAAKEEDEIRDLLMNSRSVHISGDKSIVLNMYKIASTKVSVVDA